jgi:hypothetical protein
LNWHIKGGSDPCMDLEQRSQQCSPGSLVLQLLCWQSLPRLYQRPAPARFVRAPFRRMIGVLGRFDVPVLFTDSAHETHFAFAQYPTNGQQWTEYAECK